MFFTRIGRFWVEKKIFLKKVEKKIFFGSFSKFHKIRHISWTEPQNLLIFSGMIALDSAFKEIIPSSHLYLPVFYKKLKTAKNTFSPILNDPDFSRVIRPCTVTQFTILYHHAKNLWNPKMGSMITFSWRSTFWGCNSTKVENRREFGKEKT